MNATPNHSELIESELNSKFELSTSEMHDSSKASLNDQTSAEKIQETPAHMVGNLQSLIGLLQQTGNQTFEVNGVKYSVNLPKSEISSLATAFDKKAVTGAEQAQQQLEIAETRNQVG